MTGSFANCSKRGQFKIQQMAFVLVVLMIFFAMASLFYISLRFSGLKGDVENLREQETLENIRKISGTPEFSWTAAGDCSSCIDLDKVFILKEKQSYQGFWKNTALLQVRRIYPVTGGDIECTRQNYPDCDIITLINKDSNLRGHGAFVSLCRYESERGFNKCELGKVVMAFETVS